MTSVYIIYSHTLKKCYVGHAKDVEKRLVQHNSGKGNFTSKGVPWILIIQINCINRSEAVLLELKVKKRGIGRYLADIGIR